MKNKKKINLMMISALSFVLMWGCGGGKVDVNKPYSEIREEVKTMSLKDLEKTANAYAEEALTKKEEIDAVKQRLRSLSPKEFLGDEAKKIKAEVKRIGNELKALTSRYELYAEEYKSKGGNIAALKA